MRVWGRTYDSQGNATWVEVSTDANGYSEMVYLTALCQVLKLNLGESPFYANYGIPAYQSVMTQVYPDYYVMQIQQQYAGFFSSLVITPIAGSSPSYRVRVVLQSGAIISLTVAQ